ncbi:Hypothetical protein FKW44_022408 [Caligus rogercresseyi]|uniref:Uncharacterized protein n=1 Tax=Caligus rogercresseyi TaxID=217165 RepID=A0A7T8GT53_CALRO|nr:Hypothetical protein FKW44_022408 [Caligus rogercresseyi]
MTVNRHSLRFMFEFIANPEPHTLTWEILDTNNRSLVYSKSESEIRLTGHNKYLASLLIDLSNVTVCDYSLIVENTEGFIKESAQTELKDLNTAEEDGEDEEDEVSSSTQWSLIVGILVAMCLLTTVGVIFFIAIRRCNYSKGVFYSAPRDATS